MPHTVSVVQLVQVHSEVKQYKIFHVEQKSTYL